MIGREDIRYQTLWVRLLCCFAVGLATANLAHFGILDPLEQSLRLLILDEEPVGYARLPDLGQFLVLLVICLLPALPRIERAVIMVMTCLGLAFLYLFGILMALLSAEVVFPMASPLLGLLSSTVVLETMAWSGETRKRRELEQLEGARQQFTDMLVHDLNKKISSILMSFSVLEQHPGRVEPQVADLMVTIRASANRMLMLINNLLDIRKMRGNDGLAPSRETVSLRTLLEEGIAEHRAAGEAAGMRFRLADGEDIRLSADRQIFSRVLTNLFWNAMQHAPSNSVIDIGYMPDGEDTVILYVTNRGDVISEDDQALIMQAIRQGQPAMAGRQMLTTGLGLAFCKLAAEVHGGTLQFQSPSPEYGDGVKVSLRLPRRDMVQARNV